MTAPTLPALVAVVLLVAAACGDAGVAADATGSTAVALAGGRLVALPTGASYIRVLRFRQATGTTFASMTHQAGIMFQRAGSQELVFTDPPPTMLVAGDAVFIPSLAHSHVNPGPGANEFYFVAAWPVEARSLPLPRPDIEEPFASADLPGLAPGSYTETLVSITLDPGGRSARRAPGGVEVLFLLEGSVTVRLGGAEQILAADQGLTVPAGTPVQTRNAGDRPARLLAFFITADGQPFESR